MTFLLFQAFLLMAAAYFLGAFLGCWWRRAFYEPARTRSTRRSDVAVATAGAAGGVQALNVPRNEPIPVQPRIEYVDRPDAIADRHRFERALSGTGMLEDAQHAQVEPHVESEPAPPVAEDPTHFDVAPRAPVAHESGEPVVPAEPAPATLEPIPEPDEAAARQTDDAVAAAAAAAAAAMAVAARQRATPAEPPPAPTPPPQAPPVATPLPPVAASGGMAGVSAEVRVPPLVPSDGQDLKLIAGIDQEVEHTLNGLGVWRYRDVARWNHGDVAAINNALGSRSRVQRENWIEQAAILSAGGMTAYARRRLRGELAGAHPTEAVHPSRGPAVTPARVARSEGAAPAPQFARTPASMANAGAAAVAAASAAASRGRAASHRPPPPVRAPRPAITEVAGAPGAAAPSTPPKANVTPPPASLPAAGPAVPPAHTAPAAIDALQRIRGIDPTADRVLRENDVTSYAQIAGWTATEVEYFNELLETPGRVQRENWIEQAQVLSRGATTLFARQYDTGSGLGVGGAAAVAAAAATAAAAHPAPPAAARPSRLADAMRMNQQRDAAPRPVPPPAPAATEDAGSGAPAPAEDAAPASAADAQVTPPASDADAPADGAEGAPSTRNGVSGLRSVRSEALRADRFGGPAQGIDDLKRIRGIGVLIEKKLNALGISSYDQIANWTAEDIAHISDVLDFRGRIERENWVEQARILSAGGQTEFSRRLDRGETH